MACGSGGGSGSGGSLTFANWAAAETTTRPGIQQVEKTFAQREGGMPVENQAISFSEIAQQLILRARSGNPPDIAQLAGNDTFVVAATGSLEPLDSYASEEFLSKLNDSSVETLTHEGQLVAIPWTDSPVGFWYNKEIMRKAGLDPASPPATIDELLHALEAVTKSQPDVIPLGIDTTNRPFALGSLWPWLETFGAAPIGESGANADSPEMAEFLSFMRELGQQNYIDPGRKAGDFRPLAAQGNVAFVWDQDVFQGVVQDTNGMSDEEFYDTWGVTVQPAGPTGESFTVNNGHQLVMFADSDNKEAAWRFMEFLATDPAAVKEYTIDTATTLPPLSNPSGKVGKLLDNPVTNTFQEEIIPTTTLPPYGPSFADASTAVMAGVQQAVTSDKPIDEITGAMQDRLSAVLEE